MEGYNYNNIFETKGIEYLVIIGFLLLIIPFWIFINRKRGIREQINKGIGILSESVLKIPMGLFYSRYHTWAHLEKSGLARVGLDDFLQHVTGEVKFEDLKTPGTFIKKGGVLVKIDQNGKKLQVYSPISGMITRTNALLTEKPGIINEDPYDKGWIYKIRPLEWVAETQSYYLAEGAISWTKSELSRFRDFLSESIAKNSPQPAMVVFQDGGEIRDQPLSEMESEVWQDFQNSFLK